MHAMLSRPDPRRLLPLSLAIVLPLIFAGLPTGTSRALAANVGSLPDIRAESTALNTAVEKGLDLGQSAPARAEAASRFQRAPDMPWRDITTVSDDGSRHRAAIATDAPAFAPTQAPRNATGQEQSTDQIDVLLGRLQAQDEALAREPLLGMRLAEKAFRAGGDPWSARQLSHWTALFVARVNAMAIPDGTRASLVRLVAVYEHDALAENRTRLHARHDNELPRVAASHATETTIAHADPVFGDEQRHLTEASRATRGPLW